MDIVNYKNEKWKNINEYEGIYEISNLGRVKSHYNKIHFLNLKPDKYGYISVSLTKNKKIKRMRVHRLVAQAFIPNINNYEIINHIDGNKMNNNVNNLEWSTQKYNVNQSWKLGLSKVSEKQRRIARDYCKKTKCKKVAQYDKKMELIKIWKSQAEASKKTGVSKTSINNNVCGLSKSSGGYIWEMI